MPLAVRSFAQHAQHTNVRYPAGSGPAVKLFVHQRQCRHARCDAICWRSQRQWPTRSRQQSRQVQEAAASPHHATAAAMIATGNGTAGSTTAKFLWVQTASKACFTAAIEAGIQHFVFDLADGRELAAEWETLAAIPTTLWLESGSDAANVWDGQDYDRKLAAVVRHVSSRADVEAVAALAGDAATSAVIMDAVDWQSIPAENLVAAFQDSAIKLMATAVSADDARVKLEALERGVDGVLLRTDDPLQVKELAGHVQRLAQQGAQRLRYDVATVTRLQPAGMGDRVCVDLCSNMAPGEGMLVGSFARGLLLVHSECAESAYINSRPFRVNAGPVHAYTMGEQDGSRTAYLSELCSGKVVQIADAEGRTRAATVGRVKVERRPLVLVEATAEDGEVWSTLLQNAETVRLVGPGTAADGAADSGGQGWQATSVSQLAVGSSRVYVLRQGAARHTGVAIQEQISER